MSWRSEHATVRLLALLGVVVGLGFAVGAGVTVVEGTLSPADDPAQPDVAESSTYLAPELVSAFGAEAVFDRDSAVGLHRPIAGGGSGTVDGFPGPVHRVDRGIPSLQETAIEAGPRIKSVLPDLVRTDQTVTVSYTADGNLSSVRLFAIGPGNDTVLEQAVDPGRDVTYEYDRSRIQALEGGPYDLVLEVEDVEGNVRSHMVETAFTVGDFYVPDVGEIGAVEYSTTAGDFVEIDVTLHDTEEAFLLLGGDRRDGTEEYVAPLDVLHVDGSSTFLVNTRLIGTDRPSEAVYTTLSGSVTSYEHHLGPDSEPTGVFDGLRFEDENYAQVGETLTEFRQAAGIGRQLRPLQQGRYSLVLTDSRSIVIRNDGVPDPRFPVDRSNLVLTEPSLGSVSTFLVPEGNANELRHEPDPEALEEIDATDLDAILDIAIETDTVTVGDRILLEVEATGIWGAFVDALDEPGVLSEEYPDLVTPEEFATFVGRPDGINFTAGHVDPPPNVALDDFHPLEATVSDVSILTHPTLGPDAPDLDRFYLLIDTRAPGAFPEPLEGDEEVQIGFAYESDPDELFEYDPIEWGVRPDPYSTVVADQFPYFPRNTSADRRTVRVSIDERVVDFDRTDPDGRPIVVSAPGQTISGTTSLPPGSDPVDIIIDMRFLPEAVEIENVAIDEDGRFAIQHDFSMVGPDDVVELEFWAYEERMDRREVAVFDDEDDITEYVITNFHTRSVIPHDESIVEISATIRNVGDHIGLETVELLVDGEVAEERTVAVQVDHSQTIHFVETAESLEPGTHSLTVRTPDDSAESLVVVDEAVSALAIDSLSAEAPIEGGEAKPTITTTISNHGTITGSTNVEFVIWNETDHDPPRTFGFDDVDSLSPDLFVPGEFFVGFDGEVELVEEAFESPDIDEVFMLYPISLMPGRNQTIVLDRHVPDLDWGEYQVQVRTPDDTATDQLLVRDSEFVVDEFSVPPPVESGSDMTLSVSVTNRGNLEANETVTLLFENETLGEWSPRLAPDGTERLSVADVTVDRIPGRYTVSVVTPDDVVEKTLVVEEPPEPPVVTDDVDDPVDGDEPTDEEPVEDESVALFGTRGRLAAITATAIVGAIHILGYWV